MDKEVVARFWGNVQKGPWCWGWLRSVDANGYPQMHEQVGGKTHSLKGHRVSWEIHNRPLARGEKVTRICDSRACTNPEHLVLVTPQLRKRRSAERASTQFFAMVERRGPSECWPWSGKLRNGYGYVTVLRETWKCGYVYAHRLAYELANGNLIPKGKVVRHTCDNRKCCTPSHLLLGSQADNIRDSVSRGRNARGETVWNAKLTKEQVLQIRADHTAGTAQARLAEQYGVARGTIGDIVHNRTWRHINRECK